MVIQPVKRARVYEDIVDQLAEMITRGEFRKGDRLPPERELAKAFGVGRPTLRQALTVLNQAGVLEILPGSGIYLREEPLRSGSAMAMMLMTERNDLVHILELRVGIEGEAAYLAALRRNEEDVSRLEAAFTAFENAFKERAVAVREDFRFHSLVAEATHNPVFVKVMTSLADLFMQGFKQSTSFLYGEPDRVSRNLQEHRAILSAILAQRAEDARTAAVAHLKRVFLRLQQAEEQQALRREQA